MDTTAYLEYAGSYWQLAAAIVTGIVLSIVTALLIRLLLFRRYLSRRHMIWLEVTPPSNVVKTPEATEQLFSVLHGMRTNRTVSDKLLGRSPVMSFEIVSTKRSGIRFLLHAESRHASMLQKIVAAYVPDAKVSVIDRAYKSFDTVHEFAETSHYILPLTLTSMIEQHDPLGYVTSAMTKLDDDEEITFQIIASPTRCREAERLSRRILGNENILQQISGKQVPLLSALGRLFGTTAIGATNLAGEVYMGITYGHKSYYEAQTRHTQQQAHITKHDRPARTLSAFELELMETMHRKVTQPLFRVNLRILISSRHATEHVGALKAALDGYSVPPYQSLKVKWNIPILRSFRRRNAERRLPSLIKNNAMVLAASELANLFHFPAGQISTTDNLVASLSRTLPAPLSLKSNQEYSVVIGENHHHNIVTTIGLTAAERERHMYIIGGTGNGKTTMLQYQIIQDMQNGKGVAVIDPHGDMAETLLRHVPKHRVKDVVYFNPDDLEHPFALNLLELTPGLEGNDLLREKDIITESVISVFRKIFSDDDSGGHRIEYVLRNAIHTALTVENATLFTVLKLLQNTSYRRNITNKLTDEDLKDFWKNEIGKAGDMQKVKMSAGITAKIGRFNVNAATKAILGESHSTIDFEDIMDTQKIFICNFSKGLLGEDVSELFGITVLAKLQLASLRRARIKQSQRTPYYLYVDEFQNFATPSFIQMLSESRKYKLFLTMAEQSTSQQNDQKMVNVILANVGTVICFRTGNPSDEQLLLPLFSPFIAQGEIANLDAYTFYARLSSVTAQEPVSGTTLLLDSEGDERVARQCVVASRNMYAQKQNAANLDTAITVMTNSHKEEPETIAVSDQKASSKTTAVKVKVPGY